VSLRTLIDKFGWFWGQQTRYSCEQVAWQSPNKRVRQTPAGP